MDYRPIFGPAHGVNALEVRRSVDGEDTVVDVRSYGGEAVGYLRARLTKDEAAELARALAVEYLRDPVVTQRPDENPQQAEDKEQSAPKSADF